MDRVHRDLDSKDFTYGEECVKKAYCNETGLLATSRCYSTAVGYYKADNLPGYCRFCSGGPLESETTTKPAVTTTANAGTTAPAPTAPKPTDPPVTEPPETEPPAPVEEPVAEPSGESVD